MTTAESLVGTATELAFLVRTSPPDEVRDAITHGIRAEDKDALLVVLAALVDIDRSRRELLDDIRRSPMLGETITNMQQAARHACVGAWLAYQHGDRDPQVVRQAHRYEELGPGVTQWNG